jgi:hypothetical protein
MVSVMCTSTLHRALADGGVPKRIPARGASARLGNWAAILADRKLVVAIEERTCLTLVLRLRPIAGFRDRIAAALRLALSGCQVSPRAIERDCTALHEASFMGRRHPALVEDLRFAEVECLAHVDIGQDEDSVQDMLNEYPHAGCSASCPKKAVALLFARRAGLERRAPKECNGRPRVRS